MLSVNCIIRFSIWNDNTACDDMTTTCNAVGDSIKCNCLKAFAGIASQVRAIWILIIVLICRAVF